MTLEIEGSLLIYGVSWIQRRLDTIRKEPLGKLSHEASLESFAPNPRAVRISSCRKFLL